MPGTDPLILSPLPTTIQFSSTHKQSTPISTREKVGGDKRKISTFRQPNPKPHVEFDAEQHAESHAEPKQNQQMTFAIHRTLRKIKNVVLGDNSTYRKKYASLPKNTPVPEFIELPGPWDVWEWWAGCGALTKACQKLHLRCGPTVSHSTGWCLKLPHHRQRLKELLIKHTPGVLFAAPTCGPCMEHRKYHYGSAGKTNVAW